MSRVQAIARIIVSIASVALVTVLYFLLIRVNPTTVALTYVVVVLLIATRWGIREAMVASVTAVLCFNFFFLPPILTLTIADSQNWVAFVVFMLTAIIVGQLSGHSRRRQVEALARQRDLERLYALSRALLLSDEASSAPSVIAHRIAETFELPAVALYDRHSDAAVVAGVSDLPDIESKLRDVARQAVDLREPPGTVITAIRLGGAPIGSLAIHGSPLSDTVLQSLANLAAIALERARGREAEARAEAARESAELRATLLDAVAHEFKTPLTSMKAATGDLLATTPAESREHELVEIVDEDLERLQGLVTDAVQMLRIDAGDFVTHRDRYRLADIVALTLRKLERRLDGHPVLNRVPADLLVDADRALLVLAVQQLLDNAVKYSPATSTIEICATSNGAIDIFVRNSGSVIPEREQQRLFERFYRGSQARRMPGSGMGLAIVRQIADAHGGTVTVRSGPDVGTEFTLSLPREGASS
jgi:two-component system sensor histidine kinase KdpD